MSNIIKAFINIVNNYNTNVQTLTQGNNRANNMGEGLENYIKDVFANTINQENITNKLERFSEVFSYQGNKNNPPDLILKNSDAIEIKKIQSKTSNLALNSSFPKAKIYANSPMITDACRECESWNEKDMIYVVGHLPKGTEQLKSLWLIYGDCFCADEETYLRIKRTISDGINNIANVEFTATNEFAKIKKVDPLGITDLRIRGMWHIANPTKIFDYVYEYDESKSFQLICLMKKEKYQGLPLEDRELLENLSVDGVEVLDIRIKSPNNPVVLIGSKLLVFKV
jgi:hypothetical protein